MEYTYEELEQDAINAIEEHGLFNYSQLIGFLPCSRSTFYNRELDRSNTIKLALKVSRAKEFSKAFDRIRVNESATAQIAVLKVLGDQDIRDALNGRVEEKVVKEVRVIIERKSIKSRDDIAND